MIFKISLQGEQRTGLLSSLLKDIFFLILLSGFALEVLDENSGIQRRSWGEWGWPSFLLLWFFNISKEVIQWMEKEPRMVTFKSDSELIWHLLTSHSLWPLVDPSPILTSLPLEANQPRQRGHSCITSPFALLSSRIVYSSRQHLFVLHCNYCERFAVLRNKLRWANMN